MKGWVGCLVVVLFLLGLAFLSYPGIYWFFHPDLTKMQIFRTFWLYEVLGTFFIVAGGLLAKASGWV